jgi:hypothetical protein
MEFLEKILTAWPIPISVAIIFGVAMLRRSVSALIDRTHGIKAGGVEVDMVPKQDAGKAGATAQAVAPLAAVTMPQPMMKYDSILVRRITTDLRQRVLSHFKDDISARETYLISIAADALAVGTYDYLYSHIYGSQLAAIRDLNSSGVVPVKTLQPYFDEARTNFPLLYENDGFLRWIGWLIEVTFLVERRDPEHLVISDAGRDFLQFVISRGYPLSKSG